MHNKTKQLKNVCVMLQKATHTQTHTPSPLFASNTVGNNEMQQVGWLLLPGYPSPYHYKNIYKNYTLRRVEIKSSPNVMLPSVAVVCEGGDTHVCVPLKNALHTHKSQVVEKQGHTSLDIVCANTRQYHLRWKP